MTAQSRDGLDLGVWARHIDSPGTSGKVIEMTEEKVRLDFTKTGGDRVWYPKRDVLIQGQ